MLVLRETKDGRSARTLAEGPVYFAQQVHRTSAIRLRIVGAGGRIVTVVLTDNDLSVLDRLRARDVDQGETDESSV